jgi:hypothetical protein
VDPLKHREIAKRLSPAFSARHSKAKEATLQKYVDFFIETMKDIGGGESGIEMRQWTDWLALDISADMTYNQVHKLFVTCHGHTSIRKLYNLINLLSKLV